MHVIIAVCVCVSAHSKVNWEVQSLNEHTPPKKNKNKTHTHKHAQTRMTKWNSKIYPKKIMMMGIRIFCSRFRVHNENKDYNNKKKHE